MMAFSQATSTKRFPCWSSQLFTVFRKLGTCPRGVPLTMKPFVPMDPMFTNQYATSVLVPIWRANAGTRLNEPELLA